MTGHSTGTTVTAPAPVTTAPMAGIALGALAISSSAIFIGLSQAPTLVSTFYRCALALPLLACFAAWEIRRRGLLAGREWLAALACGAFFAADMFWWGAAILEAGAGLTTVLVNVQVVIVPLIAYVIDREVPRRPVLYALPIMILGLVGASGLLQQGRTGPDPIEGALHATLAGLCYSGFLFLLRRSGGTNRTLQTYAVSVAVPAAAALVWALARPGIGALAVHADVFGWLLATAITGQGIGWLLVAQYSPRLPSAIGAALLLLTPVGSLVLGAIILDERPAPLQIAGSVVILATADAVSASSARASRQVADPSVG